MLPSFLTPRELLDFAARLRTTIPSNHVYEHVNRILRRLGLLNCSDTRIGNVQVKGISGGERKRTSIGYELIAEPPLLILDEPTSGLDSNTSLKIINLMKKEAVEGDKSLLCTIH